MTNDPTTRFEVKLQPERRRQLDELASATGMSATDLCRLAIGQLLEQRLVREPLQ
jgi:predicted transcriptional regulator